MEGIIPTSDTRLRAGLTEMPDLPSIDLHTFLDHPLKKKGKPQCRYLTSSHLHPSFLTLPSYASQEKCKKTGQCIPSIHSSIHSFFFDFRQRKKRKNSDKFHRIGFLVVSVSVSHRQTPTSFTRQILVHVHTCSRYKNPRFGSVTCLLAAWLLGC